MKHNWLVALHIKVKASNRDSFLLKQPCETGYFSVSARANPTLCTGGEQQNTFDQCPYYKINLYSGPGRVEYRDHVWPITQQALFVSPPHVPYRWVPLTTTPSGYCCLFNKEFLSPGRSSVAVEKLPIFQPTAYPLWELTETAGNEIRNIFDKMTQEISSSYAYKHDLLRTYLIQLIYLSQRQQSAALLAQAASPIIH